jgi:hypothetical protein
MYGRLGWIVSATAFVSQLVLVALLLPAKRVALLLPAVVMIAGGAGLLAVPVASGVVDHQLRFNGRLGAVGV